MMVLFGWAGLADCSVSASSQATEHRARRRGARSRGAHRDADDARAGRAPAEYESEELSAYGVWCQNLTLQTVTNIADALRVGAFELLRPRHKIQI